MRILIVDNQPRARQSMKALLDAWYPNEEMHEARNGMEAAKLAEEFLPDLILMDARMPGMNGLEATRVIKARWPQVKIIVLSMYPEFEADALAAGADAFVSKNDLPEKLRETLKKIAGKKFGE
ncbi:MAG TPA: response regulator [Anaerolineales bacterium]|nr:response regulator [Anaerolineales bacterium]